MNDTFLQWNIRGFKPNRPFLLNAIDTIRPKIISQLNLKSGTEINLNPIPPSTHWHLKTANWSNFQKELKISTEFLSPTQSCGVVTNNILSAAEKSIKKSNPTNKIQPTTHYWTPECAKAKKNKNKALINTATT